MESQNGKNVGLAFEARWSILLAEATEWKWRIDAQMEDPDAARLLFHRIAVDHAFSLELKVPNVRARRAIGEINETVSQRSARLDSTDEMFAQL